MGWGSDVGGAKQIGVWRDNGAQELLVRTGADPDVQAGSGPGPALQQSGLFHIFGPNLRSFWTLT